MNEQIEREYLPSRPFRQMTEDEEIRQLKESIDRDDRLMSEIHARKAANNFRFQTLLSGRAKQEHPPMQPLISEDRIVPPLRRKQGAPV